MAITDNAILLPVLAAVALIVFPLSITGALLPSFTRLNRVTRRRRVALKIFVHVAGIVGFLFVAFAFVTSPRIPDEDRGLLTFVAVLGCLFAAALVQAVKLTSERSTQLNAGPRRFRFVAYALAILVGFYAASLVVPGSPPTVHGVILSVGTDRRLLLAVEPLQLPPMKPGAQATLTTCVFIVVNKAENVSTQALIERSARAVVPEKSYLFARLIAPGFDSAVVSDDPISARDLTKYDPSGRGIASGPDQQTLRECRDARGPNHGWMGYEWSDLAGADAEIFPSEWQWSLTARGDAGPKTAYLSISSTTERPVDTAHAANPAHVATLLIPADVRGSWLTGDQLAKWLGILTTVLSVGALLYRSLGDWNKKPVILDASASGTAPPPKP